MTPRQTVPRKWLCGMGKTPGHFLACWFSCRPPPFKMVNRNCSVEFKCDDNQGKRGDFRNNLVSGSNYTQKQKLFQEIIEKNILFADEGKNIIPCQSTKYSFSALENQDFNYKNRYFWKVMLIVPGNFTFPASIFRFCLRIIFSGHWK